MRKEVKTMTYNPEEKTFEIKLTLNNEQASALFRAVRKRYKELYNPNTHAWEKYEVLAEMIGDQIDKTLDKEG